MTSYLLRIAARANEILPGEILPGSASMKPHVRDWPFRDRPLSSYDRISGRISDPFEEEPAPISPDEQGMYSKRTLPAEPPIEPPAEPPAEPMEEHSIHNPAAPGKDPDSRQGPFLHPPNLDNRLRDTRRHKPEPEAHSHKASSLYMLPAQEKGVTETDEPHHSLPPRLSDKEFFEQTPQGEKNNIRILRNDGENEKLNLVPCALHTRPVTSLTLPSPPVGARDKQCPLPYGDEKGTPWDNWPRNSRGMYSDINHSISHPDKASETSHPDRASENGINTKRHRVYENERMKPGEIFQKDTPLKDHLHSPGRNAEPLTPKLQPFAPEQPHAFSVHKKERKEPRLVIGRLKVEVVPSPPPVERQKIIRSTPPRHTSIPDLKTHSSINKLRFGLGQM
jgi:hypothetical protein